MKFSTILWTFYALAAHPLFVLLGFFIAHTYFSYYIETNVKWVNIPFYWALLLLFLYLRFALLKVLMRWQKRDFNTQELWLNFLRNHLWGLPTIALFIVLSLPVEGNIMGFFYMPYGMFLCLSVAPIIFYKNIRLVFPKKA